MLLLVSCCLLFLRYLMSLMRGGCRLLAPMRQKPFLFRRKGSGESTKAQSIKNPKKPDWVRQEIIRLKAFLPHHGCRHIAAAFNQRHAQKHGMTVGKSYVASTIKHHRHAIHRLRRDLKNRPPRAVPKNLIWAMDLTTVTDGENIQHPLLGMIDHGTRACLTLKHLPTKSSIALLRLLLDAVERYGKPRYLRTDNEAVFTSRLFRLGLWLLNIKHQRTEICCPWQNGRIERFFGSFKQAIRRISIDSFEQLNQNLPVYRFWYNHIRLHQNLGYRTPAQAWDNKHPHSRQTLCYFNAWEGVLTGYYVEH